MSRAIRFVTSGPPAPGIGGDRIRMFHLIRQLARRGWDVRVWSLVTADEPDGFANALQAECTEIVLAPRDVTTTQRLARFIFNTAIRRSYQRDWFTSPSTVRSAADWLSDAEAEPIVVQQLFMLPFVPLRLRRNVLLDTHNLEATRARSIADGDGQRLRRLAARAQVGPVARHERCAVRSVALSLAVSADERDAFELMAPGRVRLVPNGVDSRATVPATPTTSSSGLLFLGSLSYSPNVDAIRYFSDEISPLLLDSRAQLSVVGSSPSQAVRDAAARSRIPTKVVGFVADLGPVFSANRLMIVPLRHGAGTRLKILEALANGMPVVTTTIGAEGLGVVDGEHVLIGDDPATFAAAIRRLLVDDDLRVRLSAAGRAFVLEHYDWDRIGEVLHTAAVEVSTALASPRRLLA